MKNFKKQFISLTLISAFSVGITSCTQIGGGPTGGAGPVNEQDTVLTPMGRQTTRDADRIPGLTSRPEQKTQKQGDQGPTGGAAGTDQQRNQTEENQQRNQTREEKSTVRGYW